MGMEFPDGLLYSEEHLWVKLERGQASIGITDYAREELGEVDYVELPEPDDNLLRRRPFGIVETSKAVTDLVAPISGVVVETNIPVRVTGGPERRSVRRRLARGRGTFRS